MVSEIITPEARELSPHYQAGGLENYLPNREDGHISLPSILVSLLAYVNGELIPNGPLPQKCVTIVRMLKGGKL